MFPDEDMVERAVAHVLNCGNDVDKAREASKMFAALTKKVWPACGQGVAVPVQIAAAGHQHACAQLQLHLGLGRHHRSVQTTRCQTSQSMCRGP